MESKKNKKSKDFGRGRVAQGDPKVEKLEREES